MLAGKSNVWLDKLDVEVGMRYRSQVSLQVLDDHHISDSAPVAP